MLLNRAAAEIPQGAPAHAQKIDLAAEKTAEKIPFPLRNLMQRGGAPPRVLMRVSADDSAVLIDAASASIRLVFGRPRPEPCHEIVRMRCTAQLQRERTSAVAAPLAKVQPRGSRGPHAARLAASADSTRGERT
jgi:hypothetical protein